VDYRPGHMTVRDNTLVLGSGGGRFTIVTFGSDVKIRSIWVFRDILNTLAVNKAVLVMTLRSVQVQSLI
jgi:hypothetical protein